MKTFMAILLSIVLFCGAVFGLGFLCEGTDFFLYQFFAPKRVAVQTKVFKESQAYNDSMADQLFQEEIAYLKADKTGKATLRDIILHQYASCDTSKLPISGQQFLNQLKNSEGY